MKLTATQIAELAKILNEYMDMKEVDDFDPLVIPKVKAARALLNAIEGGNEND